MTATAREDLRKGWCPSLFEPMESGDGLIVRLKPHAATVDAGTARAVAEAASRYGNGIVELTNRANLQIRGVRPETVAPIAAVALRHGLAVADPAVERIRAVMASPLGADDPAAAFDSHALAVDIERMLAEEPPLAGLPAKFGFLVDGGGALPLAGVTTDICVRPGPEGVCVEPDGADRAVAGSLIEAVSLLRRLALAFVALAPRHGARRMSDLVARAGLAAVLGEAGLAEAEAPRRAAAPIEPVGYLPLSTAGGAVGIGVPFGQMEASALAALAGLAEACGDGALRITPWRAVMVVGVAAAAAGGLGEAAERLGFIARADDPLRRISACPGRPACGNATVATRTDALAVAAHDLAGAEVHVSGCAKGCAHPAAASLTLVGANGRYDLVLDGRAGDPPAMGGLAVDEALAAFNLLRRQA